MLASSPVEFPVEELLPRAEIQPPFWDGDSHLSAHDLPFDVRYVTCFPRVVMLVLADLSRLSGSCPVGRWPPRKDASHGPPVSELQLARTNPESIARCAGPPAGIPRRA